jgi:hypothetical protein
VNETSHMATVETLSTGIKLVGSEVLYSSTILTITPHQHPDKGAADDTTFELRLA